MDDIPLIDLPRQDAELRDDILKEIEAVIASAGFIGGEQVNLFEQQYADFIGTRHCIGVANGTDALELALRGAGVNRDDGVVIPAFTFIATAGAVLRLGAKPVPVDVRPGSLLIDPAAASAALTTNTHFIVPVHLYGQAAAVEQLPRNAVVVEDAAQSQGARRNGRPAGALGLVASTSFYPGKNIGAYGDAGAVMTDDAEIAGLIRRIANHGGLRRYEHEIVGFNSRLDAIQAVVLRVKLQRLADWNVARRAVAARYDELLADIDDVERPTTEKGNVHVWHQYVVQVPRRDEVVAALHAAGIGATVHYPTPVHLTGALESFGWKPGTFPVAEAAATRVISLPMNPTLTEPEQERVVSVLRTAVQDAPSNR